MFNNPNNKLFFFDISSKHNNHCHKLFVITTSFRQNLFYLILKSQDLQDHFTSKLNRKFLMARDKN